MSSPVIQTAPLEVDRSSSQSALSERSGRWNGRVWIGVGTCVLASIMVIRALLSSTTIYENTGRGTFLVVRHADACTAVQKFSQPLEWLRSCPSRRVDKRGGGR